jgi:hypothetical protein
VIGLRRSSLLISYTDDSKEVVVMVTIWLLTTTDDKALTPEQWQAIGKLDIWGLDRLFEKYGQHSEEPIPGYDDRYDIWRFGIFWAVLDRAQRDGELPDLLEMGSTWTQALAPRFLVELTDLALAPTIDTANTFLHRAMISCIGEGGYSGEGRIFAFPMTIDVRVLFYENAKLKPEHFRNRAQFEGAVLPLGGSSNHPRFAMPFGRDAFHFLCPILWSANGGVLHPFTLRSLIRSPQSRRALQWVSKLIHDGAAITSNPPMTLTDAERMLVAGTAQVASGGWWMWKELEGVGRSYSTALFPPDQLLAAFVGGTNLGLVRKGDTDFKADGYGPAKDVLYQLTLDEYLSEGKHIPIWRGTSLTELPAAQYNRNVGKLPPQSRIWAHWVHNDKTGTTRTFDDALRLGEVQRWPSIPESAWCEFEMVQCFDGFFEKIHKAQANEIPYLIENTLKEADKRIRESLIDRVNVYTRDKGNGELVYQGTHGHAHALSRYKRRSPSKPYHLFVDVMFRQIEVWTNGMDEEDGILDTIVWDSSTESHIQDILLPLLRSKRPSKEVREYKRKNEDIEDTRSRVTDMLTKLRMRSLFPHRVGTPRVRLTYGSDVTICFLDYVTGEIVETTRKPE